MNCVTSGISTLLLTFMSRHSVMTPLVITLCVDYHVPDPLHKRGGIGGQMYGDGLEHGAEQSIIQKPINAIEKQVSEKGRTNKLFNNCFYQNTSGTSFQQCLYKQYIQDQQNKHQPKQCTGGRRATLWH